MRVKLFPVEAGGLDTSSGKHSNALASLVQVKKEY
jgi:hypothetical protein